MPCFPDDVISHVHTFVDIDILYAKISGIIYQNLAGTFIVDEPIIILPHSDLDICHFDDFIFAFSSSFISSGCTDQTVEIS